MSNRIYIATSLDGFIAGKNGAVDWLSMVPVTEEVHSEFTNSMDTIDALVMGRYNLILKSLNLLIPK